MKKVLIAMCAMAAVLACTKTEATFEQPGEISFSPVSRYNTKAAVAPADGIGDQNVYMFAYTMADAKYFENALFEPETDVKHNNLQVYKGNPPQFWPNAINLKFAGYTVSGNVGTGTNQATASMTTWGTMTIENYSQPYQFDSKQNNDLMWFFDAGTDGDDADTTPDGYGKSTTYVTPTMKHACSWIEFKVKVDDALVSDRDASTDGIQPYWRNITVTNIKFETLNTTGTVALGETASWSSVNGNQTNVNIYNDATGKVVNGTAVDFDSVVADNVVVIPQTPTTLAMTYSYTTPANGTVTETVKGISLDYDGVDGNTEWVAGTHYTYELTIGANEIKIAPKSEGWTDYDADNNTEGVQNPTQDVK